MIVYLAGDLKQNGWRDVVIIECLKDTHIMNTMELIDPRVIMNRLVNEEEYTTWDLAQIRRSDIVFAYMDKSNPSGYGLCVELGYAKALNKPIIFVQEYMDDRYSYFGMARSIADILVDNLEEGIKILRAFAL